MSKITIRAIVGQMADEMVVGESAVDKTAAHEAGAGRIAAGPVPGEAPAHDNRAKIGTKIRPVPRVKTVRRSLGLTQEEFSARYGIPLGTLRDWEQGRTEPDQPARAYIKVIACNPEWVSRALTAEPR
jgi:DNA-binding transcriptional regulator YiaG